MTGTFEFKLTADEAKEIIAKAVNRSTGVGAACLKGSDVRIVVDQATGQVSGVVVAKADCQWSLG